MPSWTMHIVTANMLNEELNVEKNSFLIGNVIPDAQRWVVDNLSYYVEYDISHYGHRQFVNGMNVILPNVNKFVENYKYKLDNPLILGYLTHLLTDYYWNNLTYSKHWFSVDSSKPMGTILKTGERFLCDEDTMRIQKQDDFANFCKYLLSKYDIQMPSFSDKIIDNLSDMKEILATKDDVYKIINHLDMLKKSKGEFIKPQRYNTFKLFEKQEFIDNLQNCKNYILNYIFSISSFF